MDDKTLEALRGAIAHWERDILPNVLEGNSGPGACPLCQLFMLPPRPGKQACEDCPVEPHTTEVEINGERWRRGGCQGTPYEDYMDAKGDGDARRAEREAKAEVAFLRSLLPKEQGDE